MSEPNRDAAVSYAPSHRLGWLLVGVAVCAVVAAHGWYWWRGGQAIEPAPPVLAPRADGLFEVTDEVPRQVLEELRPDRASYIRTRSETGQGRVVGYHFYWEPRSGNANRLHHRPDSCMPLTGWQLEGEVHPVSVEIDGHAVGFNVFPFRSPQGRVLIYWGAYLNGELVELGSGAGLELPTTKLWEYIRTGTRRQSYEVAAFLVPYEGDVPTEEEVRQMANEFFLRTKGRKDERTKGRRD